MRHMNLKSVGEFIGQVGGAMLFVCALTAAHKFGDKIVDIPDRTSAGYDEAVKAIIDSDMFSYHKSEAIKALKRNGSKEFYRAIVHIVNDTDTFDHYKVEMIKQLSK